MMILVSAKTGRLAAVLLDNGYPTDLRTGIAGPISATHLAGETIDTVGVIGTGMQARYQIRGVKLVRKFKRFLVYGIEPDEAARYVSETSGELRGFGFIPNKTRRKLLRRTRNSYRLTLTRNERGRMHTNLSPSGIGHCTTR